MSNWRANPPQLIHVSEKPGRYAAIPCIVRVGDGRVLAALEHEEDGEATRVTFVASRDGGTAWSSPFTARVPVPRCNCALGTMNDGRLLMVCTEHLGDNLGRDNEDRRARHLPKLRRYTGALPDGHPIEAYEHYRIHSSLWIVFSRDGGRNWYDPCPIDHPAAIGVDVWAGARPAQLADGTIVIPLAGYRSPEEMSGIWLSAAILRSRDGGRNWSVRWIGCADLVGGVIYSEPAMAVLSDGRLVVLMRTESRVEIDTVRAARHGLHRVESTDGGATWTTPIRVLPGSHGSVVQLGDGQLLCATHRPIKAALSADAGETWTPLEKWFAGRDSIYGWYSNVEYVDEGTAVAMIKDFPCNERIWGCTVNRLR